LSDGSLAVGLLNKGENAQFIDYHYGPVYEHVYFTVRDLFDKRDLGVFWSSFTPLVYPHETKLLKVKVVTKQCPLNDVKKCLRLYNLIEENIFYIK